MPSSLPCEPSEHVNSIYLWQLRFVRLKANTRHLLTALERGTFLTHKIVTCRFCCGYPHCCHCQLNHNATEVFLNACCFYLELIHHLVASTALPPLIWFQNLNRKIISFCCTTSTGSTGSSERNALNHPIPYLLYTYIIPYDTPPAEAVLRLLGSSERSACRICRALSRLFRSCSEMFEPSTLIRFLLYTWVIIFRKLYLLFI